MGFFHDPRNWLSLGGFLGAAASLIAAFFNYRYTQKRTTANRLADRRGLEFSTTIRVPVEAELVKIEEVINNIKAAFLGDSLHNLREEIEEIQRKVLSPSIRALTTVLQRADDLEIIRGEDWVSFAEVRMDEAMLGFDKMCNGANLDARRREGQEQALEGLRRLCVDLRNRCSGEADRIAQGF